MACANCRSGCGSHRACLDTRAGQAESPLVSRTELKSIVDRSSAEDRLFLSAYLQHLGARDDAAVKRELDETHREIERGKKVSLSQLKRLHSTLARAGL